MMNKPVETLAPGSTIVSQTTVTSQPTGVYEYGNSTAGKGLGIFSQAVGSLAGVGLGLGSLLLIIGSAIMLSDRRNYGNFYSNDYRSAGGLFLAAFILWFLSSLFSFCGIARLFKKDTRNGYQGANAVHSLLWFLGTLCLIVGAGLWLDKNFDEGSQRYAGEILWIVGSALLLLAFLTRNIGTHADSISTARDQTFLPTAQANVPGSTYAGNQFDRFTKPLHLGGVWGNALASALYLIGSGVFLLGAIHWHMRMRQSDIDSLYQHQDIASVLWIVAGGIFFLGSLAHCAARR
jgi:hypothetical protein